MANTHHGLPLEVTANVVECNNWIDPHQQTCYVYMQYGDFKSLIQLRSPVSEINPQFPPHFVFQLINGLSELSVVVSRDYNFSSSGIIGSAKISLRNVVSHGYTENSSSLLHKGSDHSYSGVIKLRLQCANTNHRKASSSSRNIPSPHVYPTPYVNPQAHSYTPRPHHYHPYYGANNYHPTPYVNPQAHSYAPPQHHYHPYYGANNYYPTPYINPQAHSYAAPPPPPHHYRPLYGANNYYLPTMAQPPPLQGLLGVIGFATQILANLSEYFESGLGDFGITI